MPVFRFRSTSVMGVVAIAAINFAVIRAWLIYRLSPAYRSSTGDLLLEGAMPMLIILAVGMLSGLQRLRCRPFLWGFEAFGAIALTIYLVITIFFHRVWFPYIRPVNIHVLMATEPYGTFVCVSAIYFTLAAMLVLPQVAFAIIGGFLSRRFWISRRPA